MYTAQGDPFLIVGAAPQVQALLAERGFKVSLLDPQLNPSGYLLLYGAAPDLERARDVVQVLLIEGSQALAINQPGQLDELATLGLASMPLLPRPLVPAPDQALAPHLPSAVTPEPLVQEMVAQLTPDDLYDLVGGLSGEWSVTINDAPYTILTRYTPTGTPITKATRHAYEILTSLGLATWFDHYMLYGAEKRNVIAQQGGLTQPDRIFLLTAHLDSTSHVNGDPYSYAPGADDNASGSAALLSIAEILSQYEFGCTLRYALFTGEEQGLYGSEAYAEVIHSQGENLQGVLNLDMLGYSTPGSAPRIELHTRPANAGDLAIANLFRDVISAYGFQLTPLILQDGEQFSDHSSFWYYNYPAILAIEDWADHTPYYHRTGDQLETLNFTYYTEFAKAALATFAHMGCLLEGQLAGQVSDSLSSMPIAGATVEAWQGAVKVRTATTGADGSYELPLSPGIYTIRFRAEDHLGADFPGVNVTQGTTPLDASLTPCLFVRDAQIQASDWMPGLGETVSFTATVGAGEPPVSYDWDFGDGGSAAGSQASHAFINRGSYLVGLTASNACGAPDISAGVIFVDVERLFLPLAQNP
jgi:hypothetical protein